MQQRCNKKAVRQRNPRNRQEAIETADRQDAVEWLELEILRARASVERYRTLAPDRDPEHTVTLPLAIAELVLDCAKDGMGKGTGRGSGRPRSTRRHELAKSAVVAWARKRKDDLKKELRNKYFAHGIKVDKSQITNEAAKQAFKEAQAHAWERYRISLAASTIEDLMMKHQKHLAASVSDVD